jgi:hypothetical protein
MRHQGDINEKMRAILVDWMVDVQVRFRLHTDTVFLAVNVMDRFLSRNHVTKKKFQLVGIAALFISSKYEEAIPPELNDFVLVSGSGIPRDEIREMEQGILYAVDFNLSTPTPAYFLCRFSKASMSDIRMHTLSKYIAELALLEYKMLAFVPSMIAAAAVYISRRMTGASPYWVSSVLLRAGWLFFPDALPDCDTQEVHHVFRVRPDEVCNCTEFISQRI